MSTILQQPDSLSFCGNLKPFIVSSTEDVVFMLYRTGGNTPILSEKYKTNADGEAIIDIKAIIDRLIDEAVPFNFADKELYANRTMYQFSAAIDGGDTIDFYVLKGGVAGLSETAAQFCGRRFLTWQPQTKFVLQQQPEWISFYSELNTYDLVNIQAYHTDGETTETSIGNYRNLRVSIYASWAKVTEQMAAQVEVHGGIWAWDITRKAAGGDITQRYQLRNAGNEEHIFIWENTLGGLDTVSFTGTCEADQKLEHKTAQYFDDSIGEYEITQQREFKQSTGYLDRYEAEWMKDFFLSRKKYMVDDGGTVRPIAVTSSKIVLSTGEDLAEFEFTYRIGTDPMLLNLDMALEPLAAPEGLADFFLTELLAGLPSAQYSSSLNIAVQSPFAAGWQKLNMAQLWGGALPSLVDGLTIGVVDGKLRVIGASEGTGTANGLDAAEMQQVKDYVDLRLAEVDSGGSETTITEGTIVWQTGLTYLSTKFLYKILGTSYSAMPRQLTLATADATYARLDTFYLDVQGNIKVATGTPSANPASPILTAQQLGVMTVLVAAGATEPSGTNAETVYDENTEWETGSETDTYVTANFEAADNPKTGTKHIKLAIAVPDTVAEAPLHTIGETYKGGKIFWINPENPQLGLIAAVEDTAMDMDWSPLSGFSNYGTGATDMAIGAGKANTDLMLANEAAATGAAANCDQLTVAEYADWYMPSQGELEAMYFRRADIGNFGTKTYWSSTEDAWNKGRCTAFSNGATYARLKNNTYAVRAIRAFDDSQIENNQPVATYTPSNTFFNFSRQEPIAVEGGILSFWLKCSVDWLPGTVLAISPCLAGIPSGSCSMSASNLCGYNPASTEWQMVAVPIAKFAMTKATIDSFVFSLTGSWPNGIELCLDAIRFLIDTSQGVPPRTIQADDIAPTAMDELKELDEFIVKDSEDGLLKRVPVPVVEGYFDTKYDKYGSWNLTAPCEIIINGGLYNWFVATDARNIANTGWHNATESDWNTMVSRVGNTNAGKLRETGATYWLTPNTGATNEYGFNARGHGERNSVFSYLKEYCKFWLNELNHVSGYRVGLITNSTYVIVGNSSYPKYGLAIRLVKDTTNLIHGQTGTYTGNDGRIYPTICIGTQEWLSCNSAETRYRNGDRIPIVTGYSEWEALDTGGMCYFDNNPTKGIESVTKTIAIESGNILSLLSSQWIKFDVNPATKQLTIQANLSLLDITTKINDSFEATEGQTIFTTTKPFGTMPPDVYVNGSYIPPARYTAVGSTVTLSFVCSTYDSVDIVYFTQ